MYGAIVTNEFLRGRKYDEPADMVVSAAEGMGVRMRRFSNSELAVPIGDSARLRGIMGDPDFVIFWDKDVRCAENLESCGMRVFNSSECIRICDDKSLTHIALARDGVPSIPTTVLPMTFDGIGYTDTGFIERLEASHGYPMVVKDCFGSFGMQVHLAGSRGELESLLSDPRPRIVQDYVECGGTDLRLEVVGGEVVAAVRRIAREGEFRANATLGGRMEPHDPSVEEVGLALAASESVGAEFCGVDILYMDGSPVVCEVNSNAHLANLRNCTGIDASVPILKHIIGSVRG